VGTFIALVTACGGDKQTAEDTPTRGETPPSTTTAAAMPQKATLIADMPGTEGKPSMAMAVTIDGDRVVAYACNGTNDEAWFFGTQKDGVMNLTNKYQDTMTASYEGTKLTGSMTMNTPDATPVKFTASAAAEPAGIYTATMGDARATWVVMDDQRMLGVMQPNSKRDREVIDQINQQQADFKEKVRQARLDRQLQQTAQFNMGTMSMAMNGTTAGVVRVTGDMTSPPSSR
jgi:hypothetical protein